jgi:hypothetical protein
MRERLSNMSSAERPGRIESLGSKSDAGMGKQPAGTIGHCLRSARFCDPEEIAITKFSKCSSNFTKGEMRVMTNFKLQVRVYATLLCLAWIGATATQMFGASATATPTLSVTVQAAATLTTPNVTFVSSGATDFTATFTGTSVLTFGIRTNAAGGTGTLTVQGTSDFVGANAGAGPSLDNKDMSYDCAAADLTGGSGSLTGTLAYCGGAVQKTKLASATPVLSGIGAKSKATGKTLSVHYTIPDSSAFDADTYTGTVTYTVSAT